MKALLLRTGSVPVRHPFLSGSPKASLSRHGSLTGAFSGEKNTVNSHKISLHSESDCPSVKGARLSRSRSEVIRSERKAYGGSSKHTGAGSLSFPANIPEEDDLDGSGPLTLKKSGVSLGICPESGIPLVEIGFSTNGFGKGSGDGGNDGNVKVGSGNGDKSNLGDYYREMLKSNPDNPLLLRNYGKFLYEVEKDAERAEAYYGKAILTSPGDGEVLALYGKLIWETQRDESRAKSYFDRAVYASPDDCMVLGSYAHFMWEADEDEDEEMEGPTEATTAAMVSAF